MGVCVHCLQHGPPHLVNLVCPSPPPVGQAQPGVAPGQPTLLSGQPQGQPGLPPPHPQMATTPQPQQVAVMPGQFLRCYCQGGRGKLKKLMIIINGSFCSVTNYRCLGSFAMLIWVLSGQYLLNHSAFCMVVHCEPESHARRLVCNCQGQGLSNQNGTF